jgi:hypothetical protein
LPEPEPGEVLRAGQVPIVFLLIDSYYLLLVIHNFNQQRFAMLKCMYQNYYLKSSEVVKIKKKQVNCSGQSEALAKQSICTKNPLCMFRRDFF